MTAEIAILNKSAVVLAADSAVTISRGGTAKIYNTVSKIFEISNHAPIAVMLFNEMEFMGLPLDVLIREFRDRGGHRDYATVMEWSDAFLKYLEDDVACTPAQQRRRRDHLIMDAMDALAAPYEDAVRRNVAKTKKLLISKLNGILARVVDRKIAVLREQPYAPGFGRVPTDVEDEKAIAQLAERLLRFTSVSKVVLGKLKRYVSLALSRQQLSNAKTGLVFAGYGRDELCPSLVHVEIDGLIGGRLKHLRVDSIDIGRNGPDASILGFAQDDMVQSFVHGVDPDFRDYVMSLLRRAISETALQVLQSTGLAADPAKKTVAGMAAEFDKISGRYRDRANRFIDERFTQDVKDMVRAMPKQELATLAESLIDITSLKRKVTWERETVGGDVDVAVISRGEGLVWVKRKHYFPAELNSRYFVRKSRGGLHHGEGPGEAE